MPNPQRISLIFNRQQRVPVRVKAYGRYIRSLAAELRLARRRFDVTLVDDCEMMRLNRNFRGKRLPTDVLSFPWNPVDEMPPQVAREFAGFLGDIVISVEAARRNAAREGHSLETEIRQLILHGLLHLLGYDHETDRGEMRRLELGLRRKLRIGGKETSQKRLREDAAVRYVRRRNV